ncbi:WxL domain-containing protein [Paenibacillus barcinonensis]|uniref:WxL domain-containing protein n=1 Tax=Paenibacillus barcinonensis TaxID=198119 RepID=UPI001C1216B0|nr:WxL domain-containing protein [Paenibacillus barcinonensis]MBU5351829.1 WxL domain-containing protein [Paenibacillus barcinonensis]
MRKKKVLKKVPNILLSAALALSVLGSGQATAATNLIQNGGFEGSAAGGSGVNWSFGTIGNTPQSLQAAVTGEDPYEGRQAQLLAEDGASLAGDNLRIISDGYPIVQGQGLTLKFKSKIVNIADASLNYSIVFYDNADVLIGEVTSSPVTTATAGYSDFILRATPPAGATNFKIRFDSIISQDGGSYKLFIDNVEVNSTSNTVPVSGDTQVGIIGGELEFYISSGSFNDVELDYNRTMISQTSSNASVTDNTGEAKGWKLKVSSTDFMSEQLVDPSGTNATIVLKLPASAVTIQTTQLTHVSGQAVDPTYGPNTGSIALSSASKTILSADPGFGSGSYNYRIENQLTVPKTLEVVSKQGDGNIQVGQMVGTRSGVYKATVNYVIGTGL